MPVTCDVLCRWTVDDLDELSADRLRYGCLDGVLQPVATPVLAEHQRISRRLFRQLDPQLPTAVELLWGCGLRLGTDWRIPDLLVVRRDAVAERLFEPADVLLAVEVVSETSRRTDRIVKPAEYAEAGIAHHWRIEVDPPVVLWTSTLDGSRYAEPVPWSSGGRLAPFDVTVDVDALGSV